MLDIQNLNAGYGEMPVLRAINLTVGDGEIVSVVGSNGAGKSTMLKAISALIKYSGSITWKSESLHGIKAHSIVNRGIVHVPEGRKIFPDMTVVEKSDDGGVPLPERLSAEPRQSFCTFSETCPAPYPVGRHYVRR